MTWIPKYLRKSVNYKPRQRVDAVEWNALWNLNIQQGDNNTAGIEELMERMEAVELSSGRNTFTFAQNEALAEWTIAHNLGKYPSVTIVDSAGTKVVGDVEYIDENTLKVSFSAAFSGKAYLN